MPYPSLRDYQNAIINQNNFNIPFFQSESLQIFLNPRGYPFMFVGGFGAIFKFRDKDQREYAFKVFTRDVPDRSERYQALHEALQKAQLPFMADFHYVPQGLRVKGELYPAVVMEWGRGIQLDKAIGYDLADDGILQCVPFLAGELFSVVKTLQERGMGHNDLQEGNILVRDDNKLVLIDYDGMFVPSLKNWPPCEMGLPNFQHPLRDKTHFNSKIDDFALVSILYQLAVITPDLWDKYYDDRRLLLKQADYENPGQSDLIQLGIKSKELHVRALAELLVQACSLHPLEIRAIEKIEAVAEIMNWLAIPGKPVPESQAESAIQWALALKTDDVAQYEKNKLPGPDAATAEIKAVKPRKAHAGRWKALREYLEAGKAMRAKKAAETPPEKPVQAKTAPRPFARPISSGVKPASQTPSAQKVSPAPSKSSFGAALVTFNILLIKLALKYLKISKVRLVVAILVVAIMMLVVGLPLFTYKFLKPEPKQTISTPQVQPNKKERFIAKGDVVIDTRTGLMWAASDNGSDINWYDAKKYCENFKGGDYTDWRMPTIDELRSLYDSAKGYHVKCELDGKVLHLNPLIQLSCKWVWAMDTISDGSRVAVFYFGLGYRSWDHPRYDGNRRALPVRVGN